MKYFVIHSGIDWKEQVENLVNEWTKMYEGANFIVLNGSQSNWIDDATAKIRQSEKVIYVVGKESYKSENIDKEIAIAIKEKKPIYIYKLNDSYLLNKSLEPFIVNQNVEPGDVDGEIIFRKGKSFVTEINSKNIDSHITRDVTDIMKYLPAKNFTDDKTLFDQYKMFVETSEELVKRKQSVNSFYVTLNSVILGAIISIMCAINDLPILFGLVKVSLIISVFTSLVGLIVCFSWISILNSYADLNASKMKIIEFIEHHLAVNLYETEWSVMTQKVGKKKYKSFSKKERFVAILFAALYVIIVIVGIFLACV
ncbi:MAG: TIR domain-containing protein [Clostridia bacterium]|nr:TIR domain-containing protein [Clostridia bacterium]